MIIETHDIINVNGIFIIKKSHKTDMILSLILLETFAFIHASPRGATNPPTYTVNLDLPAETRWTEVVLKYRQLVADVYFILRKFLPEPAITMPIIRKIAASIDSYLPAPYAAEMRGIASILNMDLGDVVTYNLFYDISAYCTSIVMQDINGIIWHARNLDYIYTDILRNITIRIEFQKGGKTIYTGITFAGYIGILTGQRPNAFTLTIDERDQGSPLLNLLIAILDKTTIPVSFLLRDTLAMSENFTTAVDKIAYATTPASFYAILGGFRKGEAIVITKGRLGPLNLWKINPSFGRWFEVETNYDHWTPPPADDDRRDPAIKAMKSMGQNNISKKALFHIMSTKPVMNDETIYTVVMSASQPEIIEAWVRIP